MTKRTVDQVIADPMWRCHSHIKLLIAEIAELRAAVDEARILIGPAHQWRHKHADVIARAMEDKPEARRTPDAGVYNIL